MGLLKRRIFLYGEGKRVSVYLMYHAYARTSKPSGRRSGAS